MLQHLAVITGSRTTAEEPVVCISVSEVAGSTPREPGAFMLVSSNGMTGTIGGGRLEFDAIRTAREMLETRETRRSVAVSLGPAIGQCCGGRVVLAFELMTPRGLDELLAKEERRAANWPHVVVYGAGHVGRALARALAALPLHVTLTDSRQDELALAVIPGVRTLLSHDLAGLAETTPDNAAHVVMTHSHAQDSLIAAAVLERSRFRYLGIIGSRSKKLTFRRAFRELGISEEAIRRVVCPIGGGRLRDKRPEVIAALVAAEILTVLLTEADGFSPD